LADAAGYWVLVTGCAGLGIENRAQTPRDFVDFLERVSVSIVRCLADKGCVIG
jgi:hypothetical protein